MKSRKATSPLLFTFYSRFVAIHRVSRGIFVTVAKARNWKGSSVGGSWKLPFVFFLQLRSSRQRVYCSALAGSGSLVIACRLGLRLPSERGSAARYSDRKCLGVRLPRIFLGYVTSRWLMGLEIGYLPQRTLLYSPPYFFLRVSPKYVRRTGLASSLGVPPSEPGLPSVFPRNTEAARF